VAAGVGGGGIIILMTLPGLFAWFLCLVYVWFILGVFSGMIEWIPGIEGWLMPRVS